MKKYLAILMLFTTGFVMSQSVSKSELYGILEKQNFQEIKQRLIKLGFEYKGTDNDYNIESITFMKSERLGREHIQVGKNNELFMVVYKLANKDFYNAMKSLVMTSEFKYTYSYKDDKFYESDIMRIGVKDSSNIISFFVKLKK